MSLGFSLYSSAPAFALILPFHYVVYNGSEVVLEVWNSDLASVASSLKGEWTHLKLYTSSRLILASRLAVENWCK